MALEQAFALRPACKCTHSKYGLLLIVVVHSESSYGDTHNSDTYFATAILTTAMLYYARPSRSAPRAPVTLPCSTARRACGGRAAPRHSRAAFKALRRSSSSGSVAVLVGSSSGSSGSTSTEGSFQGALPPEQIGWQPEHIGLREEVVVVVVWQY